MGCSRAPTSGATPDASKQVRGEGSRPKVITLNGAGATFPYPLYSKWIAEYNRIYPHIRINYQSIGSGGGIQQITKGTVDFGATDAPMKAEEAQKASGKLLHVPTTLGAVVVTYNLEGVSGPLNLTPETLSGIFLGEIRKWDDAGIARSNPGVKLPNKDIAVVFRTDGSGTTAVFTEYLATISDDFKQKVGVGKSVKWPVGLGAKGNEGVTGQIKTSPNSIGYVEFAYATQNKLPTAAIRNKAQQFVLPSSRGATAAAEGVPMPETLHVSLANAEGEAAYPLAAYTYLLVYQDAKEPEKGAALAKFIWWAIHDGQKLASALDYAPLPAAVITQVEAALKTLRAGQKPLLDGV